MNKKVNNLTTILMMLASVVMIVIIYNMATGGDPESLHTSLSVPSASDSTGGHFTMSELPLTAVTTTATAVQQDAPPDVGSITVTGDAANIRASASVDAVVMGIAYQGDSLKVLGETTDAAGVVWYKVDAAGTVGYVCSTAVSTEEEYYVKKAYLTFDDGPSENTRAILDILDRYGVKATFFVIHHEGVDDLYRQIVERGHVIALHSYSHDYSYIYSSTDNYFADLAKLEQQVSSLTGVSPKLIRFPGGSSNSISRKHKRGIMTELAAMVEQRGYVYFDWNVESGDADATTVPKDTIVENIKNNVGTRSSVTILMHDAAPKTTTVEALPEIIEFLQAQGYAILPLTASTPAVHHTINN